MTAAQLSPQTLVDVFSAATLPQSAWTHEAHLVVGLWHVRTLGADRALGELRTGIRRLNDSHGTPNSDTRGYHETLTRLYVELLAAFHASAPPGVTFADEAGLLLASPLAARDLPARFYSRDRLMSVAARRAWVEPDLQSLDGAGTL